MVCYNPVLLFPLSGVTTKSGKQHMSVYGSLANYPHLASDPRFIRGSCGQCVGCRLEYSRQWAMRAVHELEFHEHSCFCTFTFDNLHLPSDLSVSVRTHQLLMKRIRKEFGSGIRFIMSSEYGEKFGRPHYHYCLFGLYLPDKEYLYSCNGVKYYTSEAIQSVWPYGRVIVGDVTFESVAYVARYVLKKASSADRFPNRNKEFLLVSRKPGLGYQWLQKYGSNTYDNDYVIIRGKKMKPPKYYDSKWAESNPDWIEQIKNNRISSMVAHEENNSFDRLVVRERCHQSKASRLLRPLDNST